MTDEDERRGRRDSAEDRIEKLEEKMEEFRSESRERHPELEGGGGKEQAGSAGDQREISEGRNPERGDRTNGAEDRAPDKGEAEGQQIHPDRSEKVEAGRGQGAAEHRRTKRCRTKGTWEK
jgi:hypothetical protein